jgi:hypothetical protein
MERTKLPARVINSVSKKDSLDYILKDLTPSEKANLLRDQTEIFRRLTNIKRDIYCIGEMLTAHKKLLGHGRFARWIRTAFNGDLPYSTARFYMRIYDVFKDTPGIVKYIPTKYLLMVTDKQFPDELICQFKANPEHVSKNALMTVSDLFDQLKHGRIGSNKFIELAKDQIKLGIEIAHGNYKHNLNTTIRKPFVLGTSDILRRINELNRIAEDLGGLYPPDPKSQEHRQLLKRINKTIEGLRRLKRTLLCGEGLIKHVSTPEGDQYIENL